MFSGPACGTEPSGEGLSQEELFHSMPGEHTVSGILRSVAAASAAAGIPGTAAVDGGEGCGDGRTLPHGVPAVLGPHMLRDADVAMGQFPHKHLQHGGGPMVVPPPATPPVAPIVTAPGTVIPPPSGPVPTGNPLGSPPCVVGATGASGAASVSHSCHSRTVSGVEADVSGPPLPGAGFGASGDLLPPLPGTSGTPDWAFGGSERVRDQMHEHLLGPVNGRSHYPSDVGLGQHGEAVAGAGPMLSWCPGRWPVAAAEAGTLGPAVSGLPLQHSHIHGAAGTDRGTVGGVPGSPVQLHHAGAPGDPQRPPRVSDGIGTASTAIGSVQGDRAASEDSLLNSDGGGSALEDGNFYGSDPSALNGSVMSPRILGASYDQSKG